jgi:hypothetical protein
MRRLLTTATLAAAALSVALAGPALAHHIDVAAETKCVDQRPRVAWTVNSQPGDYRFAGTASDSDGHQAAVTLAAGGATTSGTLGPITTAGTVRVIGDFWKPSGRRAEHMDRTVSYRFLDNCAPPPSTTTPPTTVPPTTAPPVTTHPTPTTEQPLVGTPTSRHHTPPKVKAKTPAQPEQPDVLPFTGPPRALVTFLLGLGLTLVGTGFLFATSLYRHRPVPVEAKAKRRLSSEGWDR